MENAHLKGRRAVVTGGARGMGYAVAKRYLEQVLPSACGIWMKPDCRKPQIACHHLAR